MVYRQVTFDRCERNRLAGQLVGSVVDLERSRLHEEIKAVTYHDLKVQQLADGSWEATVILDV